jgi:succinyl-CoA synthetase beta subunit
VDIHEYQAKTLLSAYGVPVPRGTAAFSAAEAGKAARDLASAELVVKAQIHAGGRGKAGGVTLVRSSEEAEHAASRLLAAPLVTDQTGPAGRIVRRLYIEDASAIEKEYYLAVLIDRVTAHVAFVVSRHGGVEIEAVLHQRGPDSVTTVTVDPVTGIQPHHVWRVARALGLSGELRRQMGSMMAQLYAAFIATDMTMLEINPLIVNAAGDLLCLDAKVSFDSNALYRQPEIRALRDEAEEVAQEIEAQRYGFHYIALEGSIGCMVNGAGLAMATMDIIKLYGGEPANFLDVSGGARKENVAAAFKLMTADPKVKGILVNIFGGILRCDVIAEGVVAAVRDMVLDLPLVVRLEGTNAEIGQQIILGSGLDVIPAEDLDDAAQKIVGAVQAA